MVRVGWLGLETSPGAPSVLMTRGPVPSPEAASSGSRTKPCCCDTPALSPQVIVFEERMAGPAIQFTETPHLGRSQYLD